MKTDIVIMKALSLLFLLGVLILMLLEASSYPGGIGGLF